MPTFPYFTSGYLQAEIDYANEWVIHDQLRSHAPDPDIRPREHLPNLPISMDRLSGNSNPEQTG